MAPNDEDQQVRKEAVVSDDIDEEIERFAKSGRRREAVFIGVNRTLRVVGCLFNVAIMFTLFVVAVGMALYALGWRA